MNFCLVVVVKTFTDYLETFLLFHFWRTCNTYYFRGNNTFVQRERDKWKAIDAVAVEIKLDN